MPCTFLVLLRFCSYANVGGTGQGGRVVSMTGTVEEEIVLLKQNQMDSSAAQ